MSDLEKLFKNNAYTQNGDRAYVSSGDKLLDILSKSTYYENNLEEVEIGNSTEEILFSMFIRDPRYGLGRRDLGRELMKQAGVPPKLVSTAGRFDDLLYMDGDVNGDYITRLLNEAKGGNELAKKWLPSIKGKNKDLAISIAKAHGLDANFCKPYRNIKKTDVVETLLNEHEVEKSSIIADGEEVEEVRSVVFTRRDEIDFSTVPSLAMLKHYSTFKSSPETSERFEDYLNKVKSGEEKINFSVANHYDLYRNRDKVDADMLFKELPLVELNCVPILDTSASMMDSYDSYGKANAIAHALAVGSTYDKGKVVSFSSRPELIDIYDESRKRPDRYSWFNPETSTDGSEYSKQIERMYTGDVSNTDFGKVMNLLSNLGKFPEYLVVLSDMQFDMGSSDSKDKAMSKIQNVSPHTKIVWWNFSTSSNTLPETDEYGNIFISGYNPEMLTMLEEGYDAKDFLNKLLSEYSDNINKELMHLK